MKRRNLFTAICVVCTVALAAVLFVSCLPMPEMPEFDAERGVDVTRGETTSKTNMRSRISLTTTA